MPRPATIAPTSPLEGILQPGRFGRVLPDGPGTTFSLVHPCEIASVIAAKGKSGALAAAFRKEFGPGLPAMGRWTSARGLTLCGVAPDQWLAVAPDAQRETMADKLDAKLGTLAMVTSQSHGRTLFRLNGPRARDVLAKVTPVDLHEAIFKPGMCAATQIGHTGAVIACTGSGSFDIICLRTFSQSVWAGLAELALEWGYEVR